MNQANAFEPLRIVGHAHRKTWLARLFFKRRYLVHYGAPASTTPDRQVRVIREPGQLEPLRTLIDAADFTRLMRYLHSECTVYLLEEEWSILGVAVAHHPEAAEKWFDSLPTRPGEARICSLFVPSAYRGRGVAARLRSTLLLDMAERGKKVWSVVEAENHLVRKSIAAFDKQQQRHMEGNSLIKVFGVNVASVFDRRMHLLVGERRSKL